MLHSLNIYEPDPDAAVTLMPHQVKGVEFLLDNQSALLHHDQGTGKTYIGATAAGEAPVSYTHLTLPTTPYV